MSVKIIANQVGRELISPQQFNKLHKLANLELTADSSVSGSLRVQGNAKNGKINDLLNKYPNLSIDITGVYLMDFVDPQVENALIANGIIPDEGITEAAAASITSLGTKLANNTAITAFPELKKFSNVNFSSNEFKNCTSLKTIDTSNIKRFPVASFLGCESLEEINVSSASIIDTWSFADCTCLRSIIGFGSNITSLSREAFRNCESLETVIDLPNLTGLIGDRTFINCAKIKGIIDLGSIERITGSDWYYGSFCNCTSMKYAVLPDTCATVAGFRSCKSLEFFLLRQQSVPTLTSTADLLNTNNCPIFVQPDILGDYKTANNWSSTTNNIVNRLFAIGGAEWTAKFGSSDPEAWREYIKNL